MSFDVFVVFDGECGFCTRAALWLQKLDRTGHLTLLPSQGHGVRERFSLTAAQADAAVWAFRAAKAPGREGTWLRLSGAAAIAAAIDAATGTRIASHLYQCGPMRPMTNAAYRWVARHRSAFPGVKPWCASHPDACVAASRGTVA